MRKYRRLTYLDREILQELLRKGLNFTEISKKLGFHPSTISRELKRNKGLRGYRSKQADQLALSRREQTRYFRKLDGDLKQLVTKLINLKCMVERKSRFNIFKKLETRKAKAVSKKTINALRKEKIKSITNDRGLEFFDHKSVSDKLKVPVYFCDPYSSHQRGTNENRIGVLRQYLPKKTDLANLTQKTLDKIQLEINNRPMKCLGWKTPFEVYYNINCALTS